MDAAVIPAIIRQEADLLRSGCRERRALRRCVSGGNGDVLLSVDLGYYGDEKLYLSVEHYACRTSGEGPADPEES